MKVFPLDMQALANRLLRETQEARTAAAGQTASEGGWGFIDNSSEVPQLQPVDFATVQAVVNLVNPHVARLMGVEAMEVQVALVSREQASPLYAVRRVVIDLTDVTHVDSSGLNVLVQATWELAKRGIPLRVVASPDGIVRRLFAVARANELLAVFASLDDALAAPADEPGS